jgi:energy-coupling factor transport system ATP-binding protein
LTVILSEHRLERVLQYADRVLYLPACGQAPEFGEPRRMMEKLPLAPPLVRLGRALGWSPLPLTIKEGRRLIRGFGAHQPSANLGADAPSSPTPAQPPIIRARELRYAYDERPALRGVNLEVAAGEFIALMGRNGSGKSTLLKLMVGLLKASAGSLTIAGLDARRVALDDIIRHVGYLPQHPGTLLFQDTLGAELDFTRRGHGLADDRLGNEATLARLGLAGLAGRDPRDLSGGEQQRAALAAILVAEPQVILLDEPTRGLDYEQKEALARLLLSLKAEGRTIIMATHDVELVAACADRVVLLAEGEVVVDGPARTVMSDSQVFASQINKLFRDPRFIVVEDVLRSIEA